MWQHPEEMTATVTLDLTGMTCVSISLISKQSATVEYNFSLGLRRVWLIKDDCDVNSGWTGYPSYLAPSDLEEITLRALERWQEQLIKRALGGMRPWNSQRTLRSLYAHLAGAEKPVRPK